MKTVFCALFLALGGAAPALADNPTLFAPGPGGPPIEGGRDVCWSEPGDPAANTCSSEIIGQLDLVTECANDFVLQEDTTIILARWWGEYWNGGETGDFRMNLRFYADGGCVPTDLLAEWLSVDGNQEPIDGLYVYTYRLLFPVTSGVRCWFVAQAADHEFPPQWGRLGAGEVTGCESMFRSEYFSYPDWVRLSYVEWWSPPWDVSQEFECEAGTAAARTTWGAVKELYR